MKNLKIGEKIAIGFAWVCILLLVIAATSVISALRTRANIEKVEAYRGMEVSANELMHILNETRITAGVFYETHSKASFDDVSKQLMYCDFRLDKLYGYVGAHPELASYKEPVDGFQELYAQWREGLRGLGTAYNLEDGLRAGDEAAFLESAASLKRINLLAHELLSNTILNMGDSANTEMHQAKSFSLFALYVVIVISVVSLAVAIPFAVAIMRSITMPMGHMRDILDQIGRSGDLRLEQDKGEKLQGIAKGRDETAQCMSALLHMVDHLRGLDAALEQVADGDLTVDVKLQSPHDTMGLAVKKMVENLNGKFATIASSTNRVHGNAGDLSEGSRLLASGSEAQSQSVANLAASVHEIGDKTKRNTDLANNASELISKIRANAQVGTEKMNQMIQAAMEINEASQSIGKVIKTIDDIAFQTNILALNAAVEAARAGHEGKGFAVVADEVRNLANRSAEAAQESGVLIENTMQKAALGASIAKLTSQSLNEIVQGVLQSNTMIADIASLSAEQATGVLQAVTDVRHVEQIVEQNNTIAAESARSAGEIEEQSNLLKEMVSQFCLMLKD